MVGPSDRLTRLAFAAGRGDNAALNEFVCSSQVDVWRFCAALAGREAADDLTQETFLQAIRGLSGFSGRSSARTWLLAIARNVAADSVRRAVRSRRLLERVGPRAEHEQAATGAADWMELIRALPPDRRDAFVLTQVIGFDYAEAAEVCECPIGTIRSRVARARRDLIEATEYAEQRDVDLPEVGGS